MVETIYHDRQPLPRQELLSRKETTLRAIGADTANDHFLNLADEPFTLAAFSNKQDAETVYIGHLKHPFMGLHFIDFLNAVSPHPEHISNARDAILNDDIMPERARKTVDDDQNGLGGGGRYYYRLYVQHINDSTIAVPFQEYEQGHLARWMKARANTEADDVYTELRTLKAFDFGQFVPWRSSRMVRATEDSSWHPPSSDLQATFDLYGGDMFIPFLKEQPEFQGSEYNRSFDFRTWSQGFIKLKTSPERANQILQTFMLTLSDQEKFDMVIAKELQNQVTLADLATRTVWKKAYHGPRVVVNKNSTITVNNRHGTKIQAAFAPSDRWPDSPDSGEYQLDKLVHYTFGPAAREDAIEAVIAFADSPNGRRFLSQKEASGYLRALELDDIPIADVFLGRVLSLHTSPSELTWLKENIDNMRLDSGGRMEIGPVQVPVWVSIPEHAEMILGSELFKKLEQAA